MLARNNHERPSREEDYPAWFLDQAKALRRHKPRELDWASLAEQLEEMYAQATGDLLSDLRVVLQHLLKLQFQPSDNELKRRARGWKLSATEHRNRIDWFLRHSRSVRKKLPEFVEDAYTGARKEAALHMNVEERALPAKCPWIPEQVCDLDFFAGRATSSNGHRR